MRIEFDEDLLMLEKCQLAQGVEPALPHLVTSRSRLHKEAETLFGPPISSLLTEANRELTTLLQDVRQMPPLFLECAPDVRRLRELLRRALDCAEKHHLLQEKLGTLAFTDELTGLYNRQAFLSIAHQQLQLARRTGYEFLLFFIDVDDLKQINDTFGHSAGDRALVRTAAALANTFRESDILARLGGDEFVALAIETTSRNEAVIMARLRESLTSKGSKESPYPLSFSAGAVRFTPGATSSIAELMLQADRAMYEAKGSRRTAKCSNVSFPLLKGKKPLKDSATGTSISRKAT